ncbi:hypothetical protein CASFOL_008823 [Castilleja foliolosa]|uniref:Uncharacterized protein n=1 Tax=Castilleja foliolosa TaxID=1961234 RepID=A0ABD3E030_9LAMI
MSNPCFVVQFHAALLIIIISVAVVAEAAPAAHLRKVQLHNKPMSSAADCTRACKGNFGALHQSATCLGNKKIDDHKQFGSQKLVQFTCSCFCGVKKRSEPKNEVEPETFTEPKNEVKRKGPKRTFTEPENVVGPSETFSFSAPKNEVKRKGPKKIFTEPENEVGPNDTFSFSEPKNEVKRKGPKKTFTEPENEVGPNETLSFSEPQNAVKKKGPKWSLRKNRAQPELSN